MAVITGTAGAVSGRVARRLDRLSEKQFALLVSIPGLLLLFLIVLPPTLAVFGLSTFRIELAKDDIIRNVGLNNFLVRLPADKEILDAIPRTLGFAALTTALTLPLALVTALVLNRGFRGSGLFFMVVLLPWAIASVVAGMFWRVHLRHAFRDRERDPGRPGDDRPADELAPEHQPGDLDRDRGAGLALGAAARGAAARRAPHDPREPVSGRPDGWRDLVGLVPPSSRSRPSARRSSWSACCRSSWASRCSTCCTRSRAGDRVARRTCSSTRSTRRRSRT